MHNMMLHLIKKILQTSLDLYRFRVTFRGGGYFHRTHMLRYIRGCAAQINGLVFHQKSLDKCPILVQKILRRGSYFTKIAKKICKISHF